MAQDRYFRDELAFLREQGEVFSDIYPQLARYLRGNHADPDIERLLEGFAFLTGRIREKIDDEFPEFTHSMISMLWPNYLRPIPSTTIVQFKPDGKGITHRQRVAEGCRLDSRPVEGQSCHFRTCRPVDIYPLQIAKIDASHSRESTTIELLFDNSSAASLRDMNLEVLRLYLGGQRYSAQMLYLWLHHHLDKIELVSAQGVFGLPLSAFCSVGFAAGDGILPYPKNVYEGYRVLQEYLAIPEAFHFFDIRKIADSVPAHVEGNFSVRLRFSKTLPADVHVRDDTFLLYCVPAINLFEHDADPIDLNGRRVEYPVVPSARHPSHFEIFSVDKVQGWLDADQGRVRGRERIYSPFESFQHEVERARSRTALYYRLRVRDSMRNVGMDHFISFVRSDETQCVDLNEAISVRLTCSNRQLPTRLGKGDVCVPTETTPSFAAFCNITEPSNPLRPVLDGSLLWTLISNLSLNYLSLLSRDAICSIIRAYDFKALVDRQAEQVTRLRLDGIIGIHAKPTERIIRGMPIRGLKTELELDQKYFASEGDLYLFGAVLNCFFALYASINSFHELVVINAHNKERYTWDIQVGQQPLI
ncbi:Protein ImpG/VasA [Marinobacterium lacunae]|uniref:Protein ImpG/VasA n=1 Tax=Marinobacterium lacunae TaxID=1232683 RepID=A0A081G3B8_9GAMM|nr:type VI secretion system baseplate subunit TssF [Marinobacterium lacunae]KEA65273.1 Protein ImpG/VasA [Marinobacterium lacunae]